MPESLAFGECADGSLAHISEVRSGLACGCRCPGCGTPLVARKGDQVEHHFGHHGAAGERPCHSGAESALHRFAKELLASRLAFALPPLLRDGERRPLYTGGIYRFDAAVLEHRLGPVVPDVIVRRADRDLLVELHVTHACGPDKIARIADLGLAAVEIDLSRLPHSVPRRELEDAILLHAPRQWLHNPKLGLAPTTGPDVAVQPTRPPGRPTIALERAYAMACREVSVMSVNSLAPRQIQADGLSRAIGLEVAGIGCFSVPPQDWQALILMTALDRALIGSSCAVNVEAALRQVRGRAWLRSQFRQLSGAEEAALRAALPAFAPPGSAITAWAMALSRQGILVPSGVRGQWMIRRETLQSVRDARRPRTASAR
jgi:hypothetical protein